MTIVQRLRETMRRTPKRSSGPNRLTGLLYCADCGAKLTHHNSLVQGKYIDDAFTCSRNRTPMEDCTIHYVATQKLEAAILSAIQRISWYVRNNEQEFVQRVREASSLRQEEAVKDCRKQIAQAKKRHAELDGLVKKLYAANATGKLPDKHFSRLLAEYDEEQAALEASMTEWQNLIDNWNADRVRMAEFIDLAKRYTDFSELTTPMLNEFIEKIVVHEGSGRGKQRRQRLDFYFNFIGAFEVPADIVTPMEQKEERRQQEEQAEKEERSQALAQARYEKYKQERREFTARKRAGLLTLEEQAEEERRLERNRAYQQKQRDKKKASQPEKPRKRSLEELAKLDRAGADLTPEEAERLAAYKQRKAEAVKRCREKQKAAQPPKPQQRTLKELAGCAEAGLPLTPEEAERLEAHRNRKKEALQKAERGKKAQLAYSFDIALQNEFSLEENIALARQFVSEQLVGRGMIADFAIHQPDKEDGGIPNPHFHVLCPIRPIEPDGKWGCKQRRRYRLDEDGNRIMGEDGKPLFDAVPTTDWGSPETLEHWREAWASMVNAKFEEKGLTCRIDHRSYERQGLDLLPTVHEGVAVRQMEAKGITTDKGDLNRWIKKANNILRDIRKKIVGLTDWIKAIKEELSQPQAPTLAALLTDYYEGRNAGAWSRNARIGNLKDFAEAVNFLTERGIATLEDLEAHIAAQSERVEAINTSISCFLMNDVE